MKLVKTLWLLVCVGFLLLGIHFADGSASSHADEVTLLAMVVLAGPSSFAVPVLYGGIAWAAYRIFSVVIAPTGIWYDVHLIVVWSAMVALGYWQWFIAVPRLARWVRRRWHRPGPS